MKDIKNIYDELNNHNNDLEPFQNACDILVGQILAAVFPNVGGPEEYYRAKVVYIARDKESNEISFEVSIMKMYLKKMDRKNKF